MLKLHRDKDPLGVNRGELGRSSVTTGRVATLRPIGLKGDEKTIPPVLPVSHIMVSTRLHTIRGCGKREAYKN